ncbi:MAG: zinc ribbon-containing protein [Psychrobium sp.]
MQTDKAIFKAGYHKLLESLQRRWLDDGKKTSLEMLIDKGMESYRFNHAMSDEQLRDIEWQLKVDLKEFISDSRQNPALNNSPQYLALESTIWQWALAISDKCQIEWLEVSEDIKHDGLYQTDDVVGLGQFLCLHCSSAILVYHPQALSTCAKCQGLQFRRVAFSP